VTVAERDDRTLVTRPEWTCGLVSGIDTGDLASVSRAAESDPTSGAATTTFVVAVPMLVAWDARGPDADQP